MPDPVVPVVAASAALAAVHLLAGRLRFLAGIPRNRWLSFAGGVSIAYVFVHLLPELAEGQEELAGTGAAETVEHLVWFAALAGVLVFYVLEHLALRSRREQRSSAGEDRTDPGTFWISTVSFTVYNAAIGYLLHEEATSAEALVLFTVALGVHFVVSDFSLREHHKDLYHHVGRWLLAAAVVAGAVVGVLVEVPGWALHVVVAAVAGGIVLNVLKEEVPGERQARLAPFLAGATGYATLLALA